MILDINMTESYEVYVGNLPSDVSEQQLKELFLPLGDVVDIWINKKYKSRTYAFVGFADSNTCNEACKRFDNYELHFFKLKVKRSFKKVNEKSILLDLPKKTSASKSFLLKKILNKNLRQNPDIRESFKMAMQETEYLTDSDKCEGVKHLGEECNLETLEETIIRNFKKPRQKNRVPIDIDIDLTKGKLMSLEQYNKMFNLQFTSTKTTQQQQQQQQQRTARKRIPFQLDYRSVCE